MSRRRRGWLVLALVAGWATLAGTGNAEQERRHGNLRIVKYWARASIGMARPSAAYLTIVNDGKADDRLLGVESPAAGRAELHRTTVAGGVMKMRKTGPLTVPARGRIEMKPGGLHIMLMGFRSPLKRGSSFPLTLRFEKAGPTTLRVPVLSPGSSGPAR